MTEYRVVWEIDLDAASYEDAARQAREIQQDPTNTASFFRVVAARADGSLHATDSKLVDATAGDNYVH